MSGKPKKGLSMVKLKEQNEQLSKQLEDLRALVTANIPNIQAKDPKTPGHGEVVDGATGQDVADLPEKDKDVAESEEVDESGVENPAKRKRVDKSTQHRDAAVTVDLTNEERNADEDRFAYNGPRVLNRDMVGAALEEAMQDEDTTGEFLSSYLVAGSILDDRLKFKIITNFFINQHSLN